MLNAALYCRVSSDQQEAKYGFEVQTAAGQAYAAKVGARITRTFRDVISGTTQTRHALEQLKAQAIHFDIVIIPRTDRVARDILVGPLIVGELMQAGLTVHMSDMGAYNPHDPSSVFLFAMMMAKSHTDRTTIVQNMSFGRERKVAAGQYERPINTYGYRDSEIFEPEAKWVRWVFEQSLHRGRRSIARDLNAAAVPTARNAPLWNDSQIRRITANAIYKGVYEYGRRFTCSNCGATGNLSTNIISIQPKHLTCKCGHQVTLHRQQLECPAIVTPELWEAVNDAARKRYRAELRGGPRSRENAKHYALAGRIRCGECSKAMACETTVRRRRRYYYYRCRNRIGEVGGPQCGHRKSYGAHRINAAALEAIERALTSDDLLKATLRLSAAPGAALFDPAVERERINKELQNYVRLAGKGLITDEEFAVERRRLRAALETIPDAPAGPRTPQTSDLEEWRAQVRQALKGTERDLILAADAWAVITPDGELDVTFGVSH